MYVTNEARDTSVPEGRASLLFMQTQSGATQQRCRSDAPPIHLLQQLLRRGSCTPALSFIIVVAFATQDRLSMILYTTTSELEIEMTHVSISTPQLPVCTTAVRRSGVLWLKYSSGQCISHTPITPFDQRINGHGFFLHRQCYPTP